MIVPITGRDKTYRSTPERSSEIVFTEIDKESCGDPGTPLYGIREGENFSNGGILRFECQFGFELIGEKTISCQDNNQWSANIPICICEYQTQFAGSSRDAAAEGRQHALPWCLQPSDLAAWWQYRVYYGLEQMMTDMLWQWIFNRKFFFLSPMFAVHSWIFISLCSLFVSPIIPPVPCMSNFTAPSGTVLSPDYPEGYGNNMNCVWLIQSDPGSRIHLAFNDFDLEAPYDSLTVKDGETNDAPVIGRFTGAESPSHLTSNTYTLRLEFQADHSMSGRGFNITYSSRSFFSVYSSFFFMEMTNVVSRVRQ